MNNLPFQRAEELVRTYHTRDPFALAEMAGANLYCEPLGSLQGMYSVICGRRCIFYNQDLSLAEAKLVVAHELGHDQLHRDTITEFGILKEHTLLDLTAITELEANRFAANLLLSDKNVLNMWKNDYTDNQAAAELNVPLEIFLLKAEYLATRLKLNINLREISTKKLFG